MVDHCRCSAVVWFNAGASAGLRKRQLDGLRIVGYRRLAASWNYSRIGTIVISVIGYLFIQNNKNGISNNMFLFLVSFCLLFVIGILILPLSIHELMTLETGITGGLETSHLLFSTLNLCDSLVSNTSTGEPSNIQHPPRIRIFGRSTISADS